MMISPVAGVTKADVNGAFAVLAVLADPDAAKARLEELTAEAQKASEAYGQAQAALAEASARIAEASDMLSRAGSAAEANAAEAKRLTEVSTFLARREADADARLRAVMDDRNTFNALSLEKTAELTARENAVAVREQEAASLMTEAQALKDTHEAALRKLRAAMPDA